MSIPKFDKNEPYRLSVGKNLYEYEQNGFKYNAVGIPIEGQKVAQNVKEAPPEAVVAPKKEEVKKYPCSKCDEVFDSQKKLDKHINWHEAIGTIEENPMETAEAVK